MHAAIVHHGAESRTRAFQMRARRRPSNPRRRRPRRRLRIRGSPLRRPRSLQGTPPHMPWATRPQRPLQVAIVSCHNAFVQKCAFGVGPSIQALRVWRHGAFAICSLLLLAFLLPCIPCTCVSDLHANAGYTLPLCAGPAFMCPCNLVSKPGQSKAKSCQDRDVPDR